MAVTVEQRTPFVVLDEEDTIVGVGQGATSQFGTQIGSLLWDCYPGSEALFKPYYDRARRTGEAVEFVQFYAGNVARVRAVPRDDGHLELFWERLARLDTLTLRSLVESFEHSLEALDGASSEIHRNDVRNALRLIVGGGA